MKNTWSLVAVAAALVAGLFYLSSTGRQAPCLPADDAHRNVTTHEACIACHGAGKQAPLGARHPPKEQCLVCHKVKKA